MLFYVNTTPRTLCPPRALGIIKNIRIRAENIIISVDVHFCVRYGQRLEANEDDGTNKVLPTKAYLMMSVFTKVYFDTIVILLTQTNL